MAEGVGTKLGEGLMTKCEDGRLRKDVLGGGEVYADCKCCASGTTGVGGRN